MSLQESHGKTRSEAWAGLLDGVQITPELLLTSPEVVLLQLLAYHIVYGGAEKIALQNRYVRVVSTGKSEGFVADENIAQAEGYFEKWYRAEALTWLEQFRYQKNDALELLTTVDMACEDLSRAGKVITTSTVKQIIQDSPEWKAKLNRSVFSDDNIAATIQTRRQLFSR